MYESTSCSCRARAWEGDIPHQLSGVDSVWGAVSTIGVYTWSSNTGTNACPLATETANRLEPAAVRGKLHGQNFDVHTGSEHRERDQATEVQHLLKQGWKGSGRRRT